MQHLILCFKVILSVALCWILSYILTVTDVISPTIVINNKNTTNLARTDARLDVLNTMPWFYFPYPCKQQYNIHILISISICSLQKTYTSYSTYNDEQYKQKYRQTGFETHVLQLYIHIRALLYIIDKKICSAQSKFWNNF